MSFRYTLTAHPHIEKQGHYVYDRKRKRSKFKVTKRIITGYSPVYRKYLGDILIFEVYADKNFNTAEEAKSLAKARLKRILTRGKYVTERQQPVFAEIYYTYINKEVGQVVREKI